ncbi:class I SAM-dependent methyltransferase [Reyranella sp. CPCC 100927]|uniref:class I SAM-dependent methyltransferase n=1 Tax=Reyranella sp. CPCC 100927 TaxID=2599616 RepID=UPI0011B4FB50|nr:class I SAM-dependent methyltransferase [Reyranella sp. CPCC 100927]TWT11534.1 methyltransferase domain-containing protein [Reyranella sp. CPCC 100927]
MSDVLIVMVAIAVAVIAVAVVQAARIVRLVLKARRKTRGIERDQLWERIYGLDWGDVTTNNYGFAPAEVDGPEQYQLQMYSELFKRLRARGRLRVHTDLLEVSCGRGGGLAHLVRGWPGSVRAVGLDHAENAVRACRAAHGDIANISFVCDSALSLPFADRSFDVVVNVEASNDYGDYAAFFREAHRVLRPGGAFLYCDTRRARDVPGTTQALRDAGFDATFNDITDHVIAACRQDSVRRRQLIRTRVPWLYRILLRRALENYAAIEGSRKFAKFRSRHRVYLMTCAIKTPAPQPALPPRADQRRVVELLA